MAVAVTMGGLWQSCVSVPGVWGLSGSTQVGGPVGVVRESSRVCACKGAVAAAVRVGGHVGVSHPTARACGPASLHPTYSWGPSICMQPADMHYAAVLVCLRFLAPVWHFGLT